MSRRGRHAKRSGDEGSMDSSYSMGHYYSAYRTGRGSGGQHPQQNPMARQHHHPRASPMMVSSPTPPYLPAGYGGGPAAVDPSSGGGFVPLQQPAPSAQRQQMPIQHVLHQPQQGFQQNPQFYHQQPFHFPPPLPPPPPPSGTPPGGEGGGFAAVGMGATGGEINRGSSATSGEIDQMVQQDIERGLRIDFYSETDSMLLASWASFFRDQFLEVRNQLAKANYDRIAESYRRATHFVERAEGKVIKTSAMKQLFRRHTLTKINDPIFVDACYRSIIDHFSRNPPFDGFTFGSPTWRDYMWYKAGLMKVVDNGRKEFLEWYTQTIRDRVDLFIETEASRSIGNEGERENVRRLVRGEILEAASSGMQRENSYTRVKQFYMSVYNNVLSTMGQQQQTEGGTPAQPSEHIEGKRVREVLYLDEEALLLSVLRSHLSARGDQGAKAPGEGAAPQDATSAVAYSKDLSRILPTAMQISQLLASQEANVSIDAPLITFSIDAMAPAAEARVSPPTAQSTSD